MNRQYTDRMLRIINDALKAGQIKLPAIARDMGLNYNTLSQKLREWRKRKQV